MLPAYRTGSRRAYAQRRASHHRLRSSRSPHTNPGRPARTKCQIGCVTKRWFLRPFLSPTRPPRAGAQSRENKSVPPRSRAPRHIRLTNSQLLVGVRPGRSPSAPSRALQGSVAPHEWPPGLSPCPSRLPQTATGDDRATRALSLPQVGFTWDEASDAKGPHGTTSQNPKRPRMTCRVSAESAARRWVRARDLGAWGQ